MYGYDGQTFSTWEEFLTYLSTKYGEMYDANYASIAWWGEDLHGNYLFIDGIQQLGTEGDAIANAGFSEAQRVMQAYTQNPAQFSAETFEQLARIKQTKEAVIAGTTYTNGAIQLGTSEAQGGQVLTATKPIVSDNGSVFNNPSVTQVEQIENPTIPGTFSYLATLKALGWLQLPTWTAAVAPLLGVTLGVGLYDLNPEFWEKVSRTLLPFCYDDSGTPKMPISVDSNGTVHTPEDAIEALRQLFIEEGVYNSDYEVDEVPEGLTLPSGVTLPVQIGKGGTLKLIDNSSYPYHIYDFDDDIYWAVYKTNSTPSNYTVVMASANSQSKFFSSTGRSDYPVPGTRDSVLNNNATFNGSTVYFTYTNPSSTYSSSETNAVNNCARDSFGLIFAQPMAWLQVYSAVGTEVEGTQLQPGAKYPSDLTKHLKDEFPTWYDNGIDVMNNPVATLIEDGVERWLPLTLSNTNFSSDPNITSSTETQTDAQTGTNTDSAQLNQIAQALQDLTETLTRDGILPENPTIPTDPSGETPTPTPPVITGAGSDLIAIYNPTKAQIQAFNQFLWDLDPTNLVNWKKVIANPIDAVISLHMIYATPVTGETRHIKCGYIETDVSSVIVTNQYTEIDCGTVDIAEYFHNVWDYIGTHIEIYLPFIGIVPLHVSDVMNSTIKVRYRVDVYTGACLAQIIVYKGNSFGTLYTYAGNCAVPLPLTSGSFTGVFSSLLATAGTAVFGGGPAMALGELAGHALGGHIQQNIQRSGSIGSNVGALGIRTPYVIITRKIPLDAHLYQTQYGFPANKTVTLGSLSGYTRVKDIHLAGIPCTDDELEQIESLLKDGVIIN